MLDLFSCITIALRSPNCEPGPHCASRPPYPTLNKNVCASEKIAGVCRSVPSCVPKGADIMPVLLGPDPKLTEISGSLGIRPQVLNRH